MTMIPKKSVNNFRVLKQRLLKAKEHFEYYSQCSDFNFGDIMNYLKGVNSDCLLSIIKYLKKENYKLYTPETFVYYLYCDENLRKGWSGSRKRLTKMLQNYVWYNYTARLLDCDYQMAMKRQVVKICNFKRNRSLEQCEFCCSYTLSHVDTRNTDLRISTTEIDLLTKWSKTRKSILHDWNNEGLKKIDDCITKPMYYCDECNIVCVFEDILKECPDHRTLEEELQDALFNSEYVKKDFLPLKDFKNRTGKVLTCICQKCFGVLKL